MITLLEVQGEQVRLALMPQRKLLFTVWRYMKKSPGKQGSSVYFPKIRWILEMVLSDEKGRK